MSLHNFEKHVKMLERHKKFQLMVSVGTVTCLVVGIVAPSYTIHVAALNAVTNLLWIWER